MVENNYLCWQVTCKSIYMRVSLLLFCIFSLFSSLSRGSSIPFSPIVRSYSVSDYNAGIQNWSIAQDDRGVMYIGNNIKTPKSNNATIYKSTDCKIAYFN